MTQPIATLGDGDLDPLRPIVERQSATARDTSSTSALDHEDLAKARFALRVVSADDYETWLKVGLALHAHGEPGKEVWREWSRGSAKFDETAIDEKWLSFAKAPQNGKARPTLNTIFWHADNADRSWRERRNEEGESALSERRRSRLLLTTVAELAARPRRPEVWERVQPVGSLMVAFGIPKSGKSIILQGLGVAVAEGKPFLGRNTIVDQITDENGDTQCVPRRGLVIYVCGEGSAGVADKIAAAIGVDRARNPADPFHRHFKVVPTMPNFTSKDDVAVLLGEIAKLGVRPDLIIIDTVARALGAAGLDENSTQDMGRWVAALDLLREETGAAVIGVHHAGKAGTDRGSSALRGACDVFAKIERVEPRVSRFIVEDQRDGEPIDPILVQFAPRVVGFDAHGPVERWAVVGVANTAAVGASTELDASGREVLEAIRRLQATGVSVSRSDLDAALGTSKIQTLRRVNALITSGHVTKVGHARDSRYVESSSYQNADTKTKTNEGSFVSFRRGGLQDPATDTKRSIRSAKGRKARPHEPKNPPAPPHESPLPPPGAARPPTEAEQAALHELLGGGP